MTFSLVLRVEVRLGTPIRRAIEEALALARCLQCGVVFDFNGAEIVIFPHSEGEAVLADYHRQKEPPCSGPSAIA